MFNFLTPENTTGLLAIFILIAQFIGKAIPDSATGVLGLVRKVAKFVGIYIQNQK
jgi:uncharacterized membrane protein